MCEVKGNSYEALILHGGGTPQLGFLIGLFDGLDADFSTLKCNLRTSSAGSMAILYLLIRRHMNRDEVHETFARLARELCCFSDLPGLLLETLESERRALRDFRDFNRILPDGLRVLTFQKIHEINPNIDWTVQTTIIEDGEIKESVFGAHTPDVRIIDAVAASCAVPFILAGVEIGGVNHMDGDLCQWTSAYHDERNFHIQCRPGTEQLRHLKFLTEIPFVDEILRVTCAYLSTNHVQPNIKAALALSSHRHFTSYGSSLDAELFSPLYYDAGILFSQDVVLK